MNRDEIIKMARESGGTTGWDTEQLRCDPELEETDFVFERHELVRFAAMIAAAEREACAKLCDVYQKAHGGQPSKGLPDILGRIIRQRGVDK